MPSATIEDKNVRDAFNCRNGRFMVLNMRRRTPADLKIALGQCFWIGINGTAVNDPETKRIFKEFQPGGVVLFQRNVESLEQVRKLNAELQKKSIVPLLIAVDQEGGTVERLHHLIGSIPPAMSLAAAGSKRWTRQIHTAHARILSSLGFNVNFTPVLDLALSGSDNGLGTRCFSDDPRIVSSFAREVVKAHAESGILVCGKHFPGLGDTDRDSHLQLPVVSRPWKKIIGYDLFPYKKLLNSLPFIMVNHALYPELDNKLPASLSPTIVNKFLLTKWNYQGISISDDLYMRAVFDQHNLAQSAEHALLAGNHMVLICRPEGVVEAYRRLLSRALKQGELAEKIFRSSSRVLTQKFQVRNSSRNSSVPAQMKQLGKLSRKISERSITLLQGAPIVEFPETCTLYLPRTKWLDGSRNALSTYLENRGCRTQTHFFPANVSPEGARILAKKSETVWNMIVLVNTGQHSGQLDLVREMLRQAKQVAVISGAFPEDEVPAAAEVVVASYWTASPALEAAGMVLFGERKARGKLPFVRR